MGAQWLAAPMQRCDDRAWHAETVTGNWEAGRQCEAPRSKRISRTETETAASAGVTAFRITLWLLSAAERNGELQIADVQDVRTRTELDRWTRLRLLESWRTSTSLGELALQTDARRSASNAHGNRKDRTDASVILSPEILRVQVPRATSTLGRWGICRCGPRHSRCLRRRP